MATPMFALNQPGTVLGPASGKDTYTDVEREFARITGGGGTIRNIVAYGVGGNVNPNLPAGLKFQGAGSPAAGWASNGRGGPAVWTVLSSTFSKFCMDPTMPYINGDGASTELVNPNVTFNSSVFEDNGDSGADLKGPWWRLKNTKASRNPTNYKLWAPGDVEGKAISQNPLARGGYQGIHFKFCPHESYTTPVEIFIPDMVVTGPGIVFDFETHDSLGALPPIIHVGHYTITGATQLMHVVGAAPTIDWGPQGIPTL